MEHVRLYNGIEVPALGLGLRRLTDPDICEQVILAAFREGYRHLDTARIFHNEAFVGNALQRCGLPRESIFLSTKLPPSHYRSGSRQAIERSLKLLRTDYVDLLLLHHFCGDWKQAWKTLEWAQEQGLARAIGVCHFYLPRQLKELAGIANIKPAIDQVECHPFLQHPALQSYLEEEGIRLGACYPLAGGKRAVGEHPTLLAVAQRHHRSSAQVTLRWHIQSGHIITPGTRNPDHMRSNLHALDFTLSDEDMEQIASIDVSKSFYRRADSARRVVYSFIS